MTSSWSFPPPLNATFVDAWSAQYAPSDNSSSGYNEGVMQLALAAVQNLTLREHAASNSWGGEDVVVSVGDDIHGAFTDTKLRMYGLDCILCTTGRGISGAGLGSIANACSNYTDMDKIQYYTKKNGPSSRPFLDLPELDQYSSLPNETCGVCILTLNDAEHPVIFHDYSVPFLVQEQHFSQTQMRVFNKTYPTGVVVPRPGTTTYAPPPPEPYLGTLKQANSPRNSNLIIGVVVGVLAAASILMGFIIWLWTRRTGRKKPYDSAINVGPAPQESREPLPPNVPLQQVPPVVRRPDSNAGEVPPAYHEVIRARETDA